MYAILLLTLMQAPPAEAVAKPTKQDILARGLMAIRGHFKHVTPKFSARLVKEVKTILARPGNGWLKPHQLLGLAINESDLVPNLALGLDCGITQVRVNNFARGGYRQRKLCQLLARSTFKAFEYAMAELNSIHLKYCAHWRGKSHLRCVFNVYNQGPSARNRTRCHRRKTWEGDNAKSIEHKYRKCKRLHRYYLRGLCFARGIQLGRKGRRSCRFAWSRAWIVSNYKVAHAR